MVFSSEPESVNVKEPRIWFKGINSSRLHRLGESIPGLLKRLQIRALGWAKAGQKSLVPARRVQQTNQGRAPIICPLWVPIHTSVSTVSRGHPSLVSLVRSLECLHCAESRWTYSTRMCTKICVTCDSPTTGRRSSNHWFQTFVVLQP